jgi:SPP1 gp7 family putative phage head morphogenesis protein
MNTAVGVFGNLRTDTLKVASLILSEMLVDIISKAQKETPLERFERLYREAIGKVLQSQFDRFEQIDVTRQTKEVLDFAEEVFGAETARKLKPEMERYLENAFRLGQKVKYVGEAVQTTFTTKHKAAVDWLVGHDQFWIGKVFPEHLRESFRSEIAAGIEEGLGRKEIGANLQALVMGKPGIPGERYLYDRVAGTTVNRARNWGAIFSLETAGYEEYTIRAVLDERTSDICREMDGKTFRVELAMETVRRVMASSPEELETLAPWPRYDAERNDHYITVGNRRQYLGGKSTDWLQEQGISLPPFHANCRSTYVVTRQQYQELKEHPPEVEPIVEETVPSFTPFTEGELTGKSSVQLRQLAVDKGVQYARVMNKQELMTVLMHPERCEEIARIEPGAVVIYANKVDEAFAMQLDRELAKIIERRRERR